MQEKTEYTYSKLSIQIVNIRKTANKIEIEKDSERFRFEQLAVKTEEKEPDL